MRIIAGEFKSRRLNTPEDLDIRPTPDRLRETLFNILAPNIEGITFLDAYAGTGAVGIEAISRGAARCIFIEHNRKALEILRQNIHSLKLEGRARVIHGTAAMYLAANPADIVFLDPPYTKPDEYERTLALSKAPLVIAQHATKHKLPETFQHLTRYRQVRQGDNTLSFFSGKTEE